MIKKYFSILVLSFAITNYVQGQVIVVDPPFPTADEPATIYFNAVGTAFEGYSGDV